MARTRDQLTASEEVMIRQLDLIANSKVAYKDASGNWIGATAGTGDMLKSENLSGLANYATARTNLGLDTTANQTDSTDKRFVSDIQKTNIDFLNQAYLDRDSTGLISGGVLTAGTGITINIASGVGYITSGSTKTKVTFGATTVSASNAGSNYIGIDSSGVVHSFASKPTGDYIYLGHVYTTPTNSAIIEVFSVPEYVGDFQSKVNYLIYKGFGALVDSGNAVSEGVSPLTLSINSGLILARLGQYTTNTTTSFTKLYYSTDNGWVVDSGSANSVNVTQWNDITKPQSTTLTTMTTAYWKKDLVLRLTNGNVYYIYGQSEYATEALALAAQFPTIPTEILEDSIYCASIVSQKSDASISTRLHDIRPSFDRIFGFGTSAVSGTVIGHSTLTQLDYASSGHTGFQTSLVNSAGLARALSDETGTGLVVFNDSPVFTTKIQTPTIELGHRTDTTLTRVSAGVIAVEGVPIISAGSTTVGQVPTITGTNTYSWQTPTSGGGVTPLRITIPGEQIADTVNYQGIYFYNNSGATRTISDVDIAVGVARAGTGRACAVNLYKSSGTRADGINTNAVNLFTSAIDLGTGYTSLNNVPNTTTVESGKWLSLRVTSSAGATNKASNLQVVITYA